MGISAEDFRQTMQAKTDEELYILLHVHSQDYAPEAIEAAREEFSQRQLDGPAMNSIRIAAVAEKRLRDGKPSEANEKPAGWGWSDYGSDLKRLGGLILLCFVGYAIYSGYGWLDSIGWI